jgi:hypothetical protein
MRPKNKKKKKERIRSLSLPSRRCTRRLHIPLLHLVGDSDFTGDCERFSLMIPLHAYVRGARKRNIKNHFGFFVLSRSLACCAKRVCTTAESNSSGAREESAMHNEECLHEARNEEEEEWQSPIVQIKTQSSLHSLLSALRVYICLLATALCVKMNRST